MADKEELAVGLVAQAVDLAIMAADMEEVPMETPVEITVTAAVLAEGAVSLIQIHLILQVLFLILFLVLP
jgi:hypothetical protein